MQHSSILGTFNVEMLLIIYLVLLFQSWVFWPWVFRDIGYFGLGYFGLWVFWTLGILGSGTLGLGILVLGILGWNRSIWVGVPYGWLAIFLTLYWKSEIFMFICVYLRLMMPWALKLPVKYPPYSSKFTCGCKLFCVRCLPRRWE